MAHSNLEILGGTKYANRSIMRHAKCAAGIIRRDCDPFNKRVIYGGL